jgi:chromate reductase, NAD(P)H dehydrogenase (quinone)
MAQQANIANHRDRSEVHILGLSGSTRKASFNTALLHAAKDMLPENTTLEIHDLSGLPLFSQDLEQDLTLPIRTFKQKIREADAILFASPEHNYSVTAVLKNAIEWGNRPPNDRTWKGKAAGIVSASSGPRGGVRSQLHLRQIMVDIDMYPINTPQLLVGDAETKFDRNLKLTDEQTRKILRDLLVSLVDWTRRLRSTRQVPELLLR